VRDVVYTSNGAAGVAAPLVSTILNASAVTVNVLVGVALLAVLTKPKPDTWPLLLILTAYLPSMPLIELAFVVMLVVLLPTVVVKLVTSDESEVTSPSMLDT
jgi:hypothetical protein